MPVGMHLSVSGGIHKLPDIARKIGAETYQIFASSPTSWRYGSWDPEQVALFRQKREEYGQAPVVVHTGYLINLASAKPEVRAKSLVALGEELKKADTIGADYLVYHPGKHLGDGVEVGIERIVNGVLAVQKEHQPQTLLLLENSEGSGTCLGVTFEELAAILNGIEAGGGQAGVCLDTAHLWGGGYDLSSEDSTRSVFDEFDRIVGLRKLHCLHLNDSQKEFASRTDRHDYLGAGKIGLPAFRAIANDPRLAGKALILEKSGKNLAHSKELIEQFRQLKQGIRPV